MAIIIQKDGDELEWLEEESFKKELDLKSYIAENPTVMPLRELIGDSAPMIVGEEFPTSNGPIDLLAIDRHGGIYIIETKLDFNHSKRQVVAQVMDYAAALWRDFSAGVEEFIKAVNDKYKINLENKLIESFAADENEATNITDNLAKSLRDGSFKLLVLMDKIDEKLKDLILFINANSRFDIYAIELKYYKKEQLTIIIPKLYGTEVRKRIVSSSVKFVDSSSEDFWKAVKENKGLETVPIKLLVDAIQSSIKDNAGFKYKTNNKSEEVVAIYTNKNHVPLVLYATGKLVLRYGDYSLYHRANKILLEKLSENKLFSVKDFNPDKSSRRELKLIGETSQKIEQLIALYSQAMKKAEDKRGHEDSASVDEAELKA